MTTSSSIQAAIQLRDALDDMAAGKNRRSALEKDPVSCALMSDLSRGVAAGHHGCALTCQAPIWLAGLELTSLYGIA
jgi:hypothetical protein